VTVLAWGCLGSLGFVLGCNGWLHGNCWCYLWVFWWIEKHDGGEGFLWFGFEMGCCDVGSQWLLGRGSSNSMGIGVFSDTKLM
jgi:hypothetical protein